MAKTVKIELTKIQWEVLSDLVKSVMIITPIQDWQLQSYILADLYIRKMAFWEVWPYMRPGKRRKLNLTMIQAIAMNELLGATSQSYNDLIRIHIEPQLIL